MAAHRDEPIVTIATFHTMLEASLARGALEAIGIPALVVGESSGTFSRYQGPIGFAELQVFESDAERARLELRRMQMRIVDNPPE